MRGRDGGEGRNANFFLSFSLETRSPWQRARALIIQSIYVYTYVYGEKNEKNEKKKTDRAARMCIPNARSATQIGTEKMGPFAL